jgi:NAD-dependent dihydropyrimidine dehydrogenase PreA subunit
MKGGGRGRMGRGRGMGRGPGRSREKDFGTEIRGMPRKTIIPGRGCMIGRGTVFAGKGDRVETLTGPVRIVASIDESLCTGCGQCIEICRPGALSVKNGVSVVDEAACRGCLACASMCPVGAISGKER